MNTPREKKQQQQLKKALSAKKGPVKGLRNVLSQPYSTPWPVLSNQKDCQLEELLGRFLPGLKREDRSVPWSLLRKMTKDERMAAKKKLCPDSEGTEEADKIRKLVTFGVNAVARLLEKNKLCSILLDSTVEKLLIKHLIVMAQNNKVPILLVPFLKKISLDSMGFATVAMAFRKKIMASRTACDEIHQEIVKLAEAIEVPENITLTEDSPTTPIIEDVEMSSEENKAPETSFSLSTNVYKHRTNRNERIFVPPTAKKETSETRENSNDFIAIGKDDSNPFTPKTLIPRKNQRYMDIDATELKDTKTKATYLPLKVKRIQGNNNRVKATKLSKSNKKTSLNKK